MRHRVPRPRKRRLHYRTPRTAVYKPAGIPLEGLQHIALFQEGLEGLTQAEAAERMGVSRSTFQHIAAQARRQVALALTGGYALQIEGETFELVAPHPHGPRRR